MSRRNQSQYGTRGQYDPANEGSEGSYYAQHQQYHPPQQYGGFQQQSTMQRNVVIFKQDQQSLYNIMGRALAAIERYILCVNPGLKLERQAAFYDETTRDPRYDDPSALLSDITLQLTISSASVDDFIKTHQQNALEVLAVLEKDLRDKWAVFVYTRSRQTDFYIDQIWKVLKNQPILLPPVNLDAPQAPPEKVLSNIYEYGKAQQIVEKQKKKIAKNPEAEVKFQLGADKKPEQLMENYNYKLHPERMVQ